MQSNTPSRKRPAPGTSPVVQQPIMQQPSLQQYQQLPDDPTDFGNFDFSNQLATDQTFSDPDVFENNNFAFGQNVAQPQPVNNALAPIPSTELVRINRNQELAPQNGQREQWNGFNNVPAHVDDDDEEDLEVKIAMAKKDAQGKRKQIPPFVQKLSSFLDSNNTSLIRWSDDGKSFIVLDEDEFARTLIPELFKHNNYASFVRQLNMYGFHKTVNITDGSLRQSEKARKGVKPPSMYSHPYFQRNRPELLWLIQKPGGKSSGKRKRDGTSKDQYDSDDERANSPTAETKPQELGAPNMSQDLTQLPRNELVSVRSELQKLQAQQKFISQMITQLKEQNDQFYRQATAFQALHDRHENSINAILTFLATFYNNSLEGHGAQSLVKMFTNATQTQQPQHGSVVEEYNDAMDGSSNQQVQKYQKRPPLLLTGPPGMAANQSGQPDSAITQASSARPSVSPSVDESGRAGSASVRRENVQSQKTKSQSPVIKNEAPTPDALKNVPESNDQMLNLIHNANATQASTPTNNTPAFDFSSLLDNAANGPLTPQQRDNVVRSFANMQNGEASNSNALVTPTGEINNFTSQLKQSNDALEKLSSLQKRQDARVQELNRRLQPLSPTGTIPGLDVTDADPFDSIGAPGDYDPNAFINFDGNTWDGNGNDNDDFDFGFDTSAPNNNTNNDTNWNAGVDENTDDLFGETNGTDTLAPQQADGNHSRVESLSSEATSPAATTRQDADETETPNKRPRRS